MEGIPTVVERRMTDEVRGNVTTVVFTEIDYDVGLPEDLFTERYLKSPPREYVE
ncbi:MAG: outer membrane lipoprotein-sorting protein [Candidatus Eisenbacteria bacterium]|uniref:Outer membrane lipoprotein-sorting protein n=1 Tax=Eiseniibacteriota bacterium TaxID=2212470 RepID=A0A956RP63_UNCEI|nr:outer membrane lipoprotein-sorting protein [Candidatus Eisenbacteria bacterium]